MERLFQKYTRSVGLKELDVVFRFIGNLLRDRLGGYWEMQSRISCMLITFLQQE